MQKCDFNKVVFHRLLPKTVPRSRTWTLDPDREKPGPRKTRLMKNVGNSWMQKKIKIGRRHSIIHFNTKILQEETCKRAI